MGFSKISSTVFVSHAASFVAPEAGAQDTWEPNTDVYITQAGIVINVELAGIRGEDVEITAEGNRLRIRGERPNCCPGPKCRFLLMSIHFGPFEVKVEIPPEFDLNKAQAAYQNGFLRITVPPCPPQAPKVRRSPTRANG